ncbi:hypothetical protein FRAHR75_560043 [Frankia sp. Hr75.2]|nr:hypothetical protein FRAHR75_560043 [Frankia sp. Hr75.2]
MCHGAHRTQVRSNSQVQQLFFPQQPRPPPPVRSGEFLLGGLDLYGIRLPGAHARALENKYYPRHYSATHWAPYTWHQKRKKEDPGGHHH